MLTAWCQPTVRTRHQSGAVSTHHCSSWAFSLRLTPCCSWHNVSLSSVAHRGLLVLLSQWA
jgi:hypothetical protein